MAKARPYYAPGSLSAAYFDVITEADTRLRGDDAIYAGLARPGASILELGCGTGRLSAYFAEHGFTTVGVDLAPAMLALGERRLAALPAEVRARVELRRGDMTGLDLKRTFDLVVCPFFTLAHVPAGAAWKNTLAVTARHLKPGGLAAFHLPRIEVMRAPGPANPALPVMDQAVGDGRRLQLYVRERTFRDGVNRFDQVLDYVLTEAGGKILDRSAERLTFYMADPTPFAEAAGLAPDRPPIDLGGVGDIWVFGKP